MTKEKYAENLDTNLSNLIERLHRKRFSEESKRLLFKWLNRRGRRQSLNWQKFSEMLKRFPLPEPRIKVSMFVKSVN